MLEKIATFAITFTMGFSPATAQAIVSHVVNETPYDVRYDADGDGHETIIDAIAVIKRYNYNVKNNATITLNETIIETLLTEQTDEEVIYWEIDYVENTPCRKYEYIANEETRLHVYYETENECSGFDVVMNPFTELIFTD